MIETKQNKNGGEKKKNGTIIRHNKNSFFFLFVFVHNLFLMFSYVDYCYGHLQLCIHDICLCESTTSGHFSVIEAP